MLDAPCPAMPGGIGRRDTPRRAAAQRRRPAHATAPQTIGSTRNLAVGTDAPIRDRLSDGARVAMLHRPTYLVTDLELN